MSREDIFQSYSLAIEMIDYSNREPIPEFRGEYYFLSNFYDPAPCKIPQIFPDDPVDRNIYATSEHAYQAAKTPDLYVRKWFLEAPTAGRAKRLGQELRISRKWWNARRIDVMRGVLRSKFEAPHLALKLLQTGHRELIEGNNWGDDFWGQVNGVGQNNLGKLLMELRDQLHIEIMLDIKNPLNR